MATERIEIIVNERGSVQASKNIRNVGVASKQATSSVNLLRRAFVLLGGAAALRGFVGLLDTLADLRNRLSLVTTGTIQTGAVMNRLFEISKKTRTGFEATGLIFSRASLAVAQLGISMQRTLDFTESLNQAVILSGVNAREAKAGLIQLSQGLASNRLSGDELRSVLEQLPFVGDVIAKSLRGANGELGVTRGEFRELANDGKVGTKIIIEAFENARVELAERFAKTIPTIGQSFTNLETEVLRLTQAFEDNTGITGIFASLIQSTANNVETLARVLGAAGLVGVLLLVRVGISAIIAQLALLRVAINANPLLKLLSLAANVLVIVISLVTAFADKIQFGSDKLSTLADFMLAAFQIGKEKLEEFLESFGGFSKLLELSTNLIKKFGALILGFLKNVLNFLITVADNFIGIFSGILVAIVRGIQKLPAVFKKIFTDAFNAIVVIAELAVNKLIDGINVFREILGNELIPQVTFTQLAQENENALVDFGKALADGAVEGFQGSNLFRKLADFTVQGVGQIFDAVGGVGGAIGERAAGLTQERLGREIVKKASEEFALTQLGQAGPDKSRDTVEKTKGIQFEDIIRQLRAETELLQLNSREREIQAAVVQAEEQLKRKLIDGEKQLLLGTLLLNQALADRAEILDEIQAPQIELERGVQALNSLFADGLIDLDQYNRKLRELQQSALALDTSFSGGLKKGVLDIGETFTNVGTLVSASMVNAFQGAEDALVDFVTTGKLDFKSLADDIIKDLARIAIRSAITGPLASLLSSPSAPGGPPGGGGSSGAAVVGTGIQLASLFGFRNGGEFTVGGSGGPDSQLVQFMGSPGEEVTVNKPGQSGGKPVTINFNISTPDADSFQRNQSQILAKASASLSRANARNN